MRKTKALGSEKTAWPIPIWRPLAAPPIPLHKQILNLISPRPALGGLVIPVVRYRPFHPYIPVTFGDQPEEPGEERAGHGDRRPWLEYDKHDSSPVTSLAPTVAIASTLDRSPLEPLVTNFPDLTTVKSERDHNHTPKGLYAFQTSCTPSQTPTECSPLIQGSRPFRRSFTPECHRSQLLHLYRLLHCLELARQLLYRYNLVALTSLSTAPFPADVLYEWESDMDDWWAETSGVLNVASQRAKAQLGTVKRTWKEQSARGEYISETKRMRDMWRKEVKPSWDYLPRYPERRSPRGEHCCFHFGGSADGDNCPYLAVPDWVVAIVPEPFGMDEIEEEVWGLECEGRVPVGSWRSFRGGP